MTTPAVPATAAGLLLAGSQIADAVEARLAADGLTATEALLLSDLAVNGPMTMNAVRQALAIEKSTATSLVDRMQKRGLLERRDNPTDGRSLLVHLAAPGKKAAKRAAAAFDAVDKDIAVVSEAALRGHRQVMARLAELSGRS